MLLDVQTFEYIVKDEAGEILGGYVSSDEPPMKGDIIHFANIRNGDWVEVLAVSMLLGKHDNTVVLKVRDVDVRAHWVSAPLDDSNHVDKKPKET